ncbi:MAG: YHS domain protein [Chitinophagaceae bacterium]|nr:YHS domain protein [Chitinophagaceae bacterium]
MRFICLALFLMLGLSSQVRAQDPAFRKKHFNVTDGPAIQGYDPVAYFTQQKAIKGKKELAVVYAGITYYFATADNKALFLKNPTAYEPEYGGWCAYAMGAKGEKVSIDPETFKIIDHKLYLFYNRFFNNTLKDWNKDEINLKNKADASWQKITH